MPAGVKAMLVAGPPTLPCSVLEPVPVPANVVMMPVAFVMRRTL